MRTAGPRIVLSASDLGKFLSCRYLTALDLAVARGERRKPPVYPDPAMEILKERGLEHEKEFIERERRGGKKHIVDLTDQEDRAAKTIAAMKQGADLIYQGALEHDGWMGYADVLRRIDTHSPNLGAWSYEVIDTKLSRETRGTTILQLALYSEVVGVIQGVDPEYFYVVTPVDEERYRLGDFTSYYRLVKRGLAAAIAGDAGALLEAHYPEPVEYCDFCRFEPECKQKRRDDDHLSLVAGISRLQRRELEGRGVATLASLAGMPLPLRPKPERGSAATYERVREQARVQLEGREKNAPVHELIAIKEGEGLSRLPAPSKGDLFLDLEGDPFVGDGGREYLFGLVSLGARRKPVYEAHWAFTAAEERAAFERVIDRMIAALDHDPKMHVYHFGGYEPGAMKRLMGRYATREAEVDRLLRGERFVDLLTVVRQGLRASVESYSIKKLEPFYGFERAMDLRRAGDIRAVVERCLELNQRGKITDDDRTIVATYNQDDCVSTLRLRDWLETLREELVAGGTDVPRPKPAKDEPSEEQDERAKRIEKLIRRLTRGVPDDRAERSPEQHACWLLAHMLDFHRREDKVVWWEFFALRDLAEEEWFEAEQVICGLKFEKRLAMPRTAPLDRYTFPEQICHVGVGDYIHDAEGKFGKVEWIDREKRIIDIKKNGDRAEDHPARIFAHGFVPSDVLRDTLERIATTIDTHGMESGGEFSAACSLLLREPPRLNGPRFARKSGEDTVDFAVRMATHLDGSVLPIQGPPGSGKTYTGARMICELVRQGLRVGVTANSHAVILNLLGKVAKRAAADGLELRCGHKATNDGTVPEGIREFTNNDLAMEALRAGEIHVLGATAWLWARESARDLVDVLVVDEAGQMKLANVIAVSNAANSLVLLGDPQQLDQPQRGSHPEGTDVSALEHVLGDDRVIAPERGIFLPETWRMAPAICGFCSEAFYEGKLSSRPGLEVQCLSGAAPFDGAGLWRVEVEHDGNTNDSREEAEAVERIVSSLLRRGARWTNEDGKVLPMTAQDILVVAPYNLHVELLHGRLSPRGIRVGTVDRFQGQEAAVVIYSMACSSPSEASRGIEFLYNLNRLNVATSRARCATILVASPRLFEPECKSPKQMKLANGLCRYAEMARAVTL